ncbi:MAG: AraC-like DNA-binding protein [Cyclobacteriaceae bacterium]|jgi:AraC-like DNA-binding protein
MNWNLNLISIGVFNGLMLSILFLRKKDHLYFGLFLLAHSMILIKYVGSMVELYDSFHFLIAFAEILEWLVGPFLFFYVMKSVGKKIRYPFIHYIPMLLFVFVLIPIHIYMIKNPDSELFRLEIQRSDFNFLVIPKIILGLIYIILSFGQTKNNRWLRLIITVYLIEILAVILYYFQFLIFDHNIISDLLVSSAMTISINVIAISGMMKSSIFVDSEEKKIEEKTSQHTVDLRTLERTFQKLKVYIEEEKVYLNPNIRLSELAEVLSIPEKQISQAVNECAKDNISSFINSYRIRMVEKLLIDPAFSHYTIDAIGEECGFSNKVSFYKAFKKIHNKSPREFKATITPQSK